MCILNKVADKNSKNRDKQRKATAVMTAKRKGPPQRRSMILAPMTIPTLLKLSSQEQQVVAIMVSRLQQSITNHNMNNKAKIHLLMILDAIHRMNMLKNQKAIDKMVYSLISIYPRLAQLRDPSWVKTTKLQIEGDVSPLRKKLIDIMNQNVMKIASKKINRRAKVVIMK